MALMTCPVCAAPQDAHATECGVCGRPHDDGLLMDALETPPLPDLELTAAAAVPGVVSTRLELWETHRHPEGDVAPGATMDVEKTEQRLFSAEASTQARRCRFCGVRAVFDKRCRQCGERHQEDA